MASEELQCSIPKASEVCLHKNNPETLADQTLVCSSAKCPVVVKVHKDCLKKLEKRLPKSCVSIFNSKATKFTPGRVLDKNFDHKANKKINKDNLLSLCGCKCGQGFLVKGAKARRRKKTKNEAKKQPSSKSRPLGIFGRIKVKRKPRGLSIEKRHNKLPSTKAPAIPPDQDRRHIPGLSTKAQNKRCSRDVGTSSPQAAICVYEKPCRDQWTVVAKKRSQSQEKSCSAVSTEDEEPLFISQLLDWWSYKKPSPRNSFATSGFELPIEGESSEVGSVNSGFSETICPHQSCSVSEKLKAVRGFGPSEDLRPWLRGQFSSPGRNGCWRCRKAEHEQSANVKFFFDRADKVRREHAASTGVIKSSGDISWKEDKAAPSGSILYVSDSFETLPEDDVNLEHKSSSKDTNLAETKITLDAADWFGQQVDTHTKVPSRVKVPRNLFRKARLFRQLKQWRPKLPIIAENDEESETGQSETGELVEDVLFWERIVQLKKKEVFEERAKQLSLKILNLVLDRLLTEKPVASSPLNPNAEAWSPSSYPTTLQTCREPSSLVHKDDHGCPGRISNVHLPPAFTPLPGSLHFPKSSQQFKTMLEERRAAEEMIEEEERMLEERINREMLEEERMAAEEVARDMEERERDYRALGFDVRLEEVRFVKETKEQRSKVLKLVAEK